MPQATLNYTDIRVSAKLLTRIFSHITVKNMGYKTPCWLYTQTNGVIKPTQYCHFSIKRIGYLLHRLMYTLFVGTAEPHLQCDHLCRMRACCNPSHIEVVTVLENNLRGTGIVALNAVKTHCPQGHEYIPENMLNGHPSAGRVCKLCMREHNKKKRRKQGMQDKYNRTTCYKGHPYTPENTFRKSNGSRGCRICKRAYDNDLYAKKTQAKAAPIDAPPCIREGNSDAHMDFGLLLKACNIAWLP